MTKDEVIALMLDSINSDNRELCLRNGMSEADADAQISQSQPALAFIMGNVYDKMQSNDLLK
jgi:hypothetical protein